MSFETLVRSIQPVRQRLIEHPIYSSIQSLPQLQLFMRSHVFAVWDFMSLLKSLQSHLVCTTVPWIPPQNSLGARLVNEIVLGEESDEDATGGFGSHFELYTRAMCQCGADTSPIDRLIDSLREGRSIDEALETSSIEPPARRFVESTFAVIGSNDPCAIAAAFTYGREDLIPDVFQRIVDEMNESSAGRLSEFLYYLERHIELDADSHGPMARRLMESLCGDQPAKWQIATVAARQALESRLEFWDAIHRQVSDTSDSLAVSLN